MVHHDCLHNNFLLCNNFKCHMKLLTKCFKQLKLNQKNTLISKIQRFSSIADCTKLPQRQFGLLLAQGLFCQQVLADQFCMTYIISHVTACNVELPSSQVRQQNFNEKIPVVKIPVLSIQTVTCCSERITSPGSNLGNMYDVPVLCSASCKC